MTKKIFIYIIVFCILSAFLWYQQQSKPHISSQDVLGSSAHLQLFLQPASGTTPLVDAITNAHKDILVEDYLLSDKAIIQALELAKQRGVNVEIMLEQHPFGGGNVNSKAKSVLTSDGIAFEWTSPSFTLTHEKSIIIDDAQAYILSQNLTAAAFKTNREYDILDTNAADVAEVETMFRDDWQRINFTPSDTQLVISPVNSRNKLEALLMSATNSVELTTEDINDQELISMLAEKAKTIPVELIIPTLKQLSSNQSAAQQLTDSGVQVHTISSPYMHGKMMLVDTSRAYVGSINYSTQSMDRNRELGIIISQKDIISQLDQTFQSDWQNSSVYQ